MADISTLQVQTQTRGAVPDDAVSFAVEHVTSLLRAASEPVLFARVRLTMHADPAVERPAVAQVNIDLNGRLIRAQASGTTLREAIDIAGDRLRVRLERAARNWEAQRGSQPVAEPGEWRHLSHPSAKLPFFPRPEQERTVVRHKSYALAHEVPDEAVAEAELLDYNFHLFTEKSSGQDAVVYRTLDGWRVALAHGRTARLGPVEESVSDMPVPRLPVEEAEDRLEALGQPFAFFVNAETGRGNVIYHRYDGNYGLIEPS